MDEIAASLAAVGGIQSFYTSRALVLTEVSPKGTIHQPRGPIGWFWVVLAVDCQSGRRPFRKISWQEVLVRDHDLP